MTREETKEVVRYTHVEDFYDLKISFVKGEQRNAKRIYKSNENMNEEFVNFSLAKKLKEEGFDWKTLSYYRESGVLSISSFIANNNILEECFSAPTISQVLTWLREEKKLSVEVFYGTVVTGNKFIDDAIKPCWSCCVVPTSENFYGIRTDLFKSTTNFASWEEAALAGIEYALDNLI